MKQKTCDICPRPAVWEHEYKGTGDVARYCEKHRPLSPPNSLVITIDISDWEMEALINENLVQNRRQILDQLASGEHSAKVARAAVVSREKDIAPADIMKPNKLLLQAGAQHEVSKMARDAADETEAQSNGRPPPEGTKALRAAERYLVHALPRLASKRLRTIHEKGGDVEAAAERLKEQIDAAVCELLNRSSPKPFK